jgi:hypothetical protein
VTPALHEYLLELQMTLAKAKDQVEEAQRHLAEGDLQWACNLVSLTHYPLGQAQEQWENLLAKFEQQGVTPKSP